MADVEVNYDKKTLTELKQIGLRGYMVGDYNAAVGALSKAIELLVAEVGEKDDSLGNIYLTYGKSLLEVSREETDALTEAAVPKMDEFDDDDDEGEDAETEAENKEVSAETPADAPTEAEPKKETPAEPTDVEPSSTTEDKVQEGSSKGEDGESTDEKPNEEATDLQVAWEILELAKSIFEKRESKGKKDLADTLITLGEVSLESENFESAIADIKEGLAIQNEILGSNNRTLAGTYYKLAIALSTNNQFEEAIDNFNTSLEILKEKLKELRAEENGDKSEIKDIEELIPEIHEKIADMKSYRAEAASKLTSAILAKATSTIAPAENKFDAGSSTKANDISHLVKRKRKLDEIAGDCEESAAKKHSNN